MADTGTFKNLLSSSDEPVVIVQRPPEIRVLRSVKLHLPLAVSVAVVVFLAGAAALFHIYKRNYTAHAVVYVSQVYPKTLASDQEMPRMNDSFVDDQVQMLKQTDILADALRSIPEGMWRMPGESIENAAERLSKTLKVERIQSSSQIQVELSDANANTASTVLAAVTKTYVDRSHREEFYGSDEHLKSLYNERDQLTKDLQAQIEQKTVLLNKLGLASVSTAEANPYNLKAGKLQLDLLDAEQKHSLSEAQLNSVERVDNNTQSAALDAEAEEVAMLDSGLTSYKTSLNAKRADLLAQMSGLTPQNPIYKQDAAELKQIDASMSDMTRSLKVRAAARLENKMRAQVVRDRQVEQKIRGQASEATSLANLAASKMEEANSVSNAITRLEGQLSMVDERITNLELQNSSPGSVHLLQTAALPQHPDPSKARKLALLLLPVCLFLGVFAAIARDLTDPYVWNSGDVNRLLGFEPVAVLPMRHMVADGFYREQLFRLAGGVERAVQGSDVQTVLMAPVRSGTNTGEILEQIAREMSLLGLRIVIVDSQQGERALAYPAIHETGEDYRQKPVELALAPNRKGRLGTVIDATTEFGDNADAVLLEGAPLLLSAESEYLARMVDATILVAVAGETKRTDLLRAVRLLERIRAGSVAVVLVESDLKHADPAYSADAKAYVNSPMWSMPFFGQLKEPAVGEYVQPVTRSNRAEPAGYVLPGVQSPNHSAAPRKESTPARRASDQEVRVLMDRRGLLERRNDQDRRLLSARRVQQIAVLFDRRADPEDRRVEPSRRLDPHSFEQNVDQRRNVIPLSETTTLSDGDRERAGKSERWADRRAPLDRRAPESTPSNLPNDSPTIDSGWVNHQGNGVVKDSLKEDVKPETWFPCDFPPAENLWTRPRQEPKAQPEEALREAAQNHPQRRYDDVSSEPPPQPQREPAPPVANRPAPPASYVRGTPKRGILRSALWKRSKRESANSSSQTRQDSDPG